MYLREDALDDSINITLWLMENSIVVVGLFHSATGQRSAKSTIQLALEKRVVTLDTNIYTIRGALKREWGLGSSNTSHGHLTTKIYVLTYTYI